MKLLERMRGTDGIKIIVGSAFFWAWLDAMFMSMFLSLIHISPALLRRKQHEAKTVEEHALHHDEDARQDDAGIAEYGCDHGNTEEAHVRADAHLSLIHICRGTTKFASKSVHTITPDARKIRSLR